MTFINEYFMCAQAMPEQMDFLWAHGWRHFGEYFFRYSVWRQWGDVMTVIPLRVDLTKFVLSRSQKRIIAKNRNAQVVIRDTFIDEAKEDLFYSHRNRFKEHVPDSIYSFLSGDPANAPCRNREICIYDGNRLVAASFLDIGRS